MAQFLDNTGLTTLTTLIKTELSTLKPSACLVTLKASGWDANAKTQTVTVSGVSADEASCMIIPIPAVANQSAYNNAGVNVVGQSANRVTFGCDSVPSVDLKVWVTWESVGDKTPVPLAYKGQILSMDLDGQGAKQYRVLSMNGDVAKVMAMYDDLTSVWRNDYNTTTTIGTLTVAKYEGSTLDTYLNTTWYNTLSTEAKNAIVPENVVQYCYQYYNEPNTPNTPTYTYQYQYGGSDSDYENANNVGNVTVGERNVFALDLKDIFDYFDKVCITSDELMTMFWNSTTQEDKYPWLRSSDADNSVDAWRVNGYYGGLDYYSVLNSYVVRPALNLNLNQVEFTVVDNTPLAVKGDILSMDLDGQGTKQYRVLSMNGDVAKVMAMYDTLKSVYNSTSTTTTMGSLTVQKYEGSTLDTYLNTTWYNTLTSATKAAIVPENVVCDAWYWGNTGDPDYTGTYGNSVSGTSSYTISKYAGGTLNIGNRNVFALGVQDVIDYLNDSAVQVDTTAILSNVNILKMFWNDEVSHPVKFPWLRSSDADSSDDAWYVNSDFGSPSSNVVDNSYVVRPALNLNLNQVEFTVVDKTPFKAPGKGTIISMDLDGNGAKQYRVIKSSGEVAQVMAMYDTLKSVYNSTSTTTTMGSLTVQKYEGSTLDTYLNTTWYNTLTSATKAAIVPENVVCDTWYWDNTGDPDYTGTYGNSVSGTSSYTISKYAGGTLNIGNRNVFALGVQDVIDYLNDSSVQVDTTAILRNVNIWKMFWNDEVSHSGKYPLLRSSLADNSDNAWYVIGDRGDLNYGNVRDSHVVRPALNLNLNQIEFTIV